MILKLSKKMEGIRPSDIRKFTSIVEARNGINLAQGHCFIEPLQHYAQLIDGVTSAFEMAKTKSGFTTYVHASGIQPLLTSISKKLREFNGIDTNPDMINGNIVVTHGASGAISCTLDAIVDAGSEVILFEPTYNYHTKAVQLKGGVPRFLPLKSPDWSFSPERLESLINENTRAIIINTPNNPTGKVFSLEELQTVSDICIRKNIVAITDEVYEFITYDQAEHISLASLPGMAERTVTISSYSKTLAATGIRIGYAAAPVEIASRIRVANEVGFICANAPIQHALVDLTNNWKQFLDLRKSFERKRGLLVNALEDAGFQVNVPKGAYYVLADFSDLAFENDQVAVNEMIKLTGIGAVPGSAFYSGDDGMHKMRFCFAVRDEDLEKAKNLLRRLGSS